MRERVGATLDGARFAELMAMPVEDLHPECLRALQEGDMRYRVLSQREREEQLLAAFRAGEAEDLRPSGPHRAEDWERGWHENLRAFEAAGYATEELIPRYNKYDVLRLDGEYIQVADKGFEYAFYNALRQQLFARWFGDCEAVTEFGCGTGTSLILLAQSMPELRIRGCDWAPSSQAILAQISRQVGREVASCRFDMFQPDADLRLEPGSGVLTSAAMEQLGSGHAAFVDYLCRQRPRICLHIEPIYEFYADNLLFDEVARRYHRHRNYLRGFLPRLHELQARGEIEILQQQRSGFGSFYHEGYSIVVWRPMDRGGRA